MEQKAVDEIKCDVSKDTLLAYPYLNRCFDIHIDTSNYQLVTVIIQNGKLIAFCSLKLTGKQTRYKVTGNEFLSIVKPLKEFHTIVLGQELKIYTDHKNLTCKNVYTDFVLMWILRLE